MRSITEFLNQPYPPLNHPARQLVISSVTALTVFITLFYLEPFNMNLLSESNLLRYALIYALISFAGVLLFTVVAPKLFSKTYQEENWVVYKELLNIFLMILAISFANLIAHHLLDGDALDFKGFIKSISYVLPLAAFPITLAVLIKQKRLQNKYQQQGKEISTLMRAESSISAPAIIPETHLSSPELLKANQSCPPAQVTITGSNEGEVLQILLEDFRFIQSEDNYVKVYWMENGRIKTDILRNTLKNLESKFSNHPRIKRSHRGYIINLDKVEQIVGDAQGLKIKLMDLEEFLPVGKTYLPGIKELLINPGA